MGVTISKPAINIREKLTEASAVVPYEQRQFHFDNLVTNGTFDTDTSGWSLGNTNATNTTLASTSSQLVITSSANDNDGQWAQQAFSTVVGKTYTVSAEYAGETNTYVRLLRVGGATITTASSIITTITNPAVGTFTTTFVATSATTYIAVGHGHSSAPATSTWDNISVYEIDPSDNKVIHTMPKGWKPLHVFEDGTLQREGSAYDYTVEYDGFNYVIKETVAPVAPYSTTVIGVRA